MVCRLWIADNRRAYTCVGIWRIPTFYSVRILNAICLCWHSRWSRISGLFERYPQSGLGGSASELTGTGAGLTGIRRSLPHPNGGLGGTTVPGTGVPSAPHAPAAHCPGTNIHCRPGLCVIIHHHSPASQVTLTFVIWAHWDGYYPDYGYFAVRERRNCPGAASV